MSTLERTATRPAPPPVHPLGSKARVLLSSVFGPYAQDDEYGSRTINPMELHHNQVTRVQGPFSLRLFHRSWGLMMIQSNLEAPCTLLDFPDLDRFIAEIRDHEYDVVGISGIVANYAKVAVMCDLVRKHLPRAALVVGGHVCTVPDLKDRIDADHIVRGEGIRWFQAFLGEDTTKPFRHAEIMSSFGFRVMGVSLGRKHTDTTATLIPSVGCPIGCNFCCTSAMFGGKGKHVPFYRTGDELYSIMSQLADSMGIQAFFVMDENFLLYRPRALRLLELMEKNDKSWSLSLFSSFNAIGRYTMDELMRLGVSWLWLGLEGEESRYRKLAGADTVTMVRDLQRNGINVLGSTIIGLEKHTVAGLNAVIEYAISHHSDFHQFMLYMPLPGTPLYEEMSAEGRLLDESEFPLADIHGQARFNYRHPHIRDGREGEYLLNAFRRDLRMNGPSLVRIAKTLLAGWRRHREHPDPRVRRRVARESEDLATAFAAMAGGAVRFYRNDPEMLAKVAPLKAELIAEFGWRARLWAGLGGRLFGFTARREARRLAQGKTFEPRTFYDLNAAAMAASPSTRGARLCRQVVASTAGGRHLSPVTVDSAPAQKAAEW